MTPGEAVAALSAIHEDNRVNGHMEADEILQAATHPEVAEAYEKARERCGGWWYA